MLHAWLGGVLVGALLGSILVIGAVTAMARIAYPQDEVILANIADIDITAGVEGIADAARERLYQELAERYGRGTLRGWMADSSLIPTVLDVTDAIPANVLGLIPGEFASALDTLGADLES